MKNKKLLPIGFSDLLFEEAEKNHKNINIVLDLFLKNNYRLIKTPLVEFADNFDKTQNAIYASDILSGKTLAFRNDITLQISRLLGTRLQNEKLPIKLCYVGDVLCAKNYNLDTDRQQTQAGIEIIGNSSEKSDIEIIQTLLLALEKLNLKNLLISFSIPNFLDEVLESLKIENSAEIKEAITKKNLSLIKKLTGKNSDLISKIAATTYSLKALENDISKKIKSKKISYGLENMKKISAVLENKFPKIQISFDLFGGDASYHDGIIFDVFCDGIPYPIAKGGRYKIKKNDENLDAVGATIYMNYLRSN